MAPSSKPLESPFSISTPFFVSFSPVIYGMSGLLEYTLSHFNNGKGTFIKDIINGTDWKIDILS